MEIEELWKNIKGELGNLEKRIDARMDEKFETMEKNAIEREKGIEERAIKREKDMEEKINRKFETINANIAKVTEERITKEVREVKRALKENEIENKKLDIRVSILELKVNGF